MPEIASNCNVNIATVHINTSGHVYCFYMEPYLWCSLTAPLFDEIHLRESSQSICEWILNRFVSEFKKHSYCFYPFKNIISLWVQSIEVKETLILKSSSIPFNTVCLWSTNRMWSTKSLNLIQGLSNCFHVYFVHLKFQTMSKWDFDWVGRFTCRNLV